MTTTRRAALIGLPLAAGPANSLAGQDSRPTFTVGTATAQRGQKVYGVPSLRKGDTIVNIGVVSK
jgi:hypothetical protein